MTRTLIVLSMFTFMWLVSAQFDYFQMVQQWPPTKCSGAGVQCGAPPPLPTMFTIHGLWPSNYSNVGLVCTGKAFDPQQKIAALMPTLNTYWPDLVYKNNSQFWRHEWFKHGTCSDPPFNLFQYFQMTLNIRRNPNYDILAILNTAGFGPTTIKFRQYQDIEGAIKAATGMKPGLHCNTNARTKKSQLFEIVLCFKSDGVTLIDCPPSVGASCPSQFVWLT